MRINNDFIIIGVDAGYGNMKTANTIFPTGLAAMDTKPYFDGDIMHYNGRWYRIGEGHKAFNPDKTADEDFYILTLASIAAELRTKDITEANIYLAIGLPTTWTVRQRNAYSEYMMRNKDVEFVFNDIGYQLLHIREGREKGLSDLRLLRQISDEYGKVDRRLRETRMIRKALIAEKRELFLLHVFKHKELAAKIAEKTEDIEELKTRRASILRRAGCKDDVGGNELQRKTSMIEGMLQKLDEQERKFSALSEQTIQKYTDLQRQATQIDADKMNAARQSVRAKYQDTAKKKLEDTFGERYSLMRMMNSRKQTERMMKEKGNSGKRSVRQEHGREETR